jgi:hypothetical protein
MPRLRALRWLADLPNVKRSSMTKSHRPTFASALLSAACCFAFTSQAQNRGVYPLGMSATNSGVTPEPGFTYVNQLLIYSRDKSKGPDGEVLGTGSNSVVMDMNTLAWVSKKKILGGAKFSMSATLPVAKTHLPLTSPGRSAAAPVLPIRIISHSFSAGTRSALPFARSTDFWHRQAASRLVRMTTWVGLLDARVLFGQTFYLTKDKATILSAFQMYEIHTTQEGTHPSRGRPLIWTIH